MTRARFVVILASLVVVLTVDENVWFQSTMFSLGNFTRDANHELVVEKIISFSVWSPVDCTFNCIGNPQCLSFNFAAHPDSEGLYLCDLLATDKYRTDSKDFQGSDETHHFSTWVNNY